MNHFQDLQEQHNRLLAKEAEEQDILQEALAYIEKIRSQTAFISAPQERDQMRANARYWATYVHKRTGTYPNTELSPPTDGDSNNFTVGFRSYTFWIIVFAILIILSISIYSYNNLSFAMGLKR